MIYLQNTTFSTMLLPRALSRRCDGRLATSSFCAGRLWLKRTCLFLFFFSKLTALTRYSSKHARSFKFPPHRIPHCSNFIHNAIHALNHHTHPHSVRLKLHHHNSRANLYPKLSNHNSRSKARVSNHLTLSFSQPRLISPKPPRSCRRSSRQYHPRNPIPNRNNSMVRTQDQWYRHLVTRHLHTDVCHDGAWPVTCTFGGQNWDGEGEFTAGYWQSRD